jgi:hypothetical protein
MPTGFQGVRNVSAEITARKQSFVQRNYLHFRLKNDGDSAVVRFLEQGDGIHWCRAAQLLPKQGMQYGDWEPILDQEQNGTSCPLVEAGLKVSFRGYINLIWRDAPVYKKGEDGKLVKPYQQIGQKDQLGLWAGGITLFDELDGKDATYRGLCSRDFRVTRRGSGMNTRYSIEPADPDAGPQPMTPADVELLQQKPDLKPFVTPKSYEDLLIIARGGTPAGQGGGQTVQQAQEFNPFLQQRPA